MRDNLTLDDLEPLVGKLAGSVCLEWDVTDQEKGELIFEAIWFALEKFTSGKFPEGETT